LRGTAGANAVAAALLPAAATLLLPAADGARTVLGLGRHAFAVLLLINPVSLLVAGSGFARAFGAGETRFLTSGQAGTCQTPADYAAFADLPRGRVLAFIDAGPFILMQSRDAVFGAPYHRNQTGNLAALDAFMAAPGEAAAEMAEHGVDYVAFCPGAPERYQYAELAPQGLAAALVRDEAPAFLDRVPARGSDLHIYRVRR
jgi:hypothetical protein